MCTSRVIQRPRIGFGDTVTPGPEEVQYPVMLPEFEAPKLRVYPRYTVVAEKLEALASLGIANNRKKDYFDLWILSCHTEFDGDTLRRAIRATFDRRATKLSPGVPFGLTDSFAQDTQKQMQWQAFLGKNRLEALHLEEVVASLRDFLLPVIAAANADTHLGLGKEALGTIGGGRNKPTGMVDIGEVDLQVEDLRPGDWSAKGSTTRLSTLSSWPCPSPGKARSSSTPGACTVTTRHEDRRLAPVVVAIR